MRTLTITNDHCDYRVPGPTGEPSAYYTDDKQDALDTAAIMWPLVEKFRFKTVDEHPDQSL